MVLVDDVNGTPVNRVEPWLWGIVAPLPAVALAVWLGATVGPLVHSPEVGISVATAALVAIGAVARKRKGRCAAAFAGGVVTMGLAAVGLVAYALSHMTQLG